MIVAQIRTCSLVKCVLCLAPTRCYSSCVVVQPNVLPHRCEVSDLLRNNHVRTQFCVVSKKRFVLRKKPEGALLSKTAHQVEREFTMLSALHKHNIKPTTPPEEKVPIPEPIILCEDPSIVGTPFYIMEFLDGRIFTDTRILEIDPIDRHEWCVEFYSIHDTQHI